MKSRLASRLGNMLLLLALFLVGGVLPPTTDAADGQPFQLATFSADVTIPLDHRCMGILPTKSKKIVDRLFAHGFVVLGADKPIVLCAVDWCEIRNGAYDQWRDALAAVAGTTRERVLVSSLHQHDAPVTDAGAAQILTSVGLQGELYDEAFHDETLVRIATALRDSLAEAQPVTHLGMGQARVKDVASNRRVAHPDGRVSYGRGSNSGGDEFYANAPEGLIDPFLKTISFWNGDKPLAALHSYATHPMSYYGRGEVTSDFVGLARERRQRDDFSVRQIYVSGCSGDVTAGKYNNGTPELRLVLVERMYQAMVEAWENTKRVPLDEGNFRNTTFELEYHPSTNLTNDALTASLHDEKQTVERRILAAMSLSSRQRVAARQPIDLPCVDFGPAQIVLFPGEVFVGYQLMAQQMRPESFVLSGRVSIESE